MMAHIYEWKGGQLERRCLCAKAAKLPVEGRSAAN